MVRALVFSTLYPNGAQPNHGIFVENRLRHTLALGRIEASVLAPVPFFPFTHEFFGQYATFARVPTVERRHGLDVQHPRYWVVPKIGNSLTPSFLYRTALRAVRRLERTGWRPDVIDAHYFYPDGVAAAWLGQTLHIPVVITGRGTDLTLIPRQAGPRALIQGAAAEASAMITVCADLKDHLVRLGVAPERVVVMRNGVDLEQFTPGVREQARATLAVERFTLASVGSLIPRKGHHLAIEAVARMPDCELLIAGGGPMRADLQALIGKLGVGDRVRLLGEIPHASLVDVYRAADALVLASEREGWANVLLEAMACGTPVIATNVNGTAEVVQTAEAGKLTTDRSADALLQAVMALRSRLPSRSATRHYAEQFSWSRIARANSALLTAVSEHGYERRHAPEIISAARRFLETETVAA